MSANLFAIIRERMVSQANVLLRSAEGAVVTEARAQPLALTGL